MAELKINGDHFQQVLGEEVERVRGSIKTRLALLKGSPKKNPLLNLYNSGRLTKECILQEMPLLQDKKSQLPSGERQVYSEIISISIKRTAYEEAKEKHDEKARHHVESGHKGHQREEREKVMKQTDINQTDFLLDVFERFGKNEGGNQPKI